MSIMKVIEVLAESSKSWEDAAQSALKEASSSIRNIKSLYVENMQVSVKGKAPMYRLDAKISFEVDERDGGEGRSAFKSGASKE